MFHYLKEYKRYSKCLRTVPAICELLTRLIPTLFVSFQILVYHCIKKWNAFKNNSVEGEADLFKKIPFSLVCLYA